MSKEVKQQYEMKNKEEEAVHKIYLKLLNLMKSLSLDSKHSSMQSKRYKLLKPKNLWSKVNMRLSDSFAMVLMVLSILEDMSWKLIL